MSYLCHRYFVKWNGMVVDDSLKINLYMSCCLSE